MKKIVIFQIPVDESLRQRTKQDQELRKPARQTPSTLSSHEAEATQWIPLADAAQLAGITETALRQLVVTGRIGIRYLRVPGVRLMDVERATAELMRQQKSTNSNSDDFRNLNSKESNLASLFRQSPEQLWD